MEKIITIRRMKQTAVFIFILLMVTVSGYIKAYAAQTIRLWGDDRYITAAAISQDGWEQSEYAIVVYGENFPDALSASVLAKKYNAPILLTGNDVLNTNTKNELIRLKTKHVFIIGGTGVVGTAVENMIHSMGITTDRFYGNDRYETAVAVAKQITPTNGIVVTTGEDFADALSVSPIAGKLQMPIILVPKDFVPKSVKDYVDARTISKVYVLGGADIVSDNVAQMFPNMQRITGNDKFERNVNIIKAFEGELSYNNIFIASGENFPDALAGSSLAAMNSNPIVLTGKSYNPVNTKKFVESKLPYAGRVSFLGGEGALSNASTSELVESNDTTSNDDNNNQTGNLSVQDIAKNASSVVYIEVMDKNGEPFASGSGFIISQDGKIVTNYHVIDGAYSAAATLEDGTKFDIEEVVNYSRDADIAILKLKGYSKNNPVKLGDSSMLQLGESVVAIGSPVGYKNTVSTGIISGFREGQMRTGSDVQISCPISAGSSGGALFNMRGEVVGITYAGRTDAQNLNFAIPINEVKGILDSGSSKTFAQVIEESRSSMNTDDFTIYLLENYSRFKDGDSYFDLNDILILDSSNNPEEPGSVYVYLYIDSSNFLNMLYYADSNPTYYQMKIETWEYEINKELMERYPDTTIYAGIRYRDSYYKYPGGFDPDYIEYNSETGLWDVNATVFFTSNASGEFMCRWLYPFN